MHPEVVDDQSGACPICRMALTPVRLELVWSCQLHLDVTEHRAGRCRICGRQLVKIIVHVPGTSEDQRDQSRQVSD